MQQKAAIKLFDLLKIRGSAYIIDIPLISGISRTDSVKLDDKMIIEQAKVSDAEEILSLQKLSYISEAEIYKDFNIAPLIQTLEEIKRDFGNQVFFKAIIEGKIIGSVRAFAKEDSCYIGRLIVHPDFQNRGIGTELINKIEEVFNLRRRFELFTGHKSEKNIHIYQKLGYKIFKTKKITDNINFIYMEKINGSNMLD